MPDFVLPLQDQNRTLSARAGLSRWLLVVGMVVHGAHASDHHSHSSQLPEQKVAQSIEKDASHGIPESLESERDAASQLITHLNRIRSLHGRYRQETLSADHRTLQSTTGELWVDASQRFRIVSDDPFEPVLVSDGQSFWNYDVGLDQVTISTLDGDVQQVPVLLLSGQADKIGEAFLVERFELEKPTGSGVREQYLLKPRGTESIFETMTLGIEDDLPRTISVSDSLGQQTTIELTELRINPALEDAIFELEIPSDIDVIDER